MAGVLCNHAVMHPIFSSKKMCTISTAVWVPRAAAARSLSCRNSPLSQIYSVIFLNAAKVMCAARCALCHVEGGDSAIHTYIQEAAGAPRSPARSNPRAAFWISSSSTMSLLTTGTRPDLLSRTRDVPSGIAKRCKRCALRFEFDLGTKTPAGM